MGRRSAWRKGYLPVILELARKGHTDREITYALRVAKSTFSDWLRCSGKAPPDLAEKLAEAREHPVREVESSFFKRANGFMVQLRKIEIDPEDPNHERIQKITVEDKYFPPSVPAGLFILTNKLPKEYKSRQTREITATGIKMYIGVSPDEWDDVIDVVSPGGNGDGQKQIEG